MASKKQVLNRRAPVVESKTGAPGDWLPEKAPAADRAPFGQTIEFDLPDVDQVYKDLQAQPDRYAEAMRAIESGRAEVIDAVLFCGRFDQSGRLLREAGRRPYKMVQTRGDAEYRSAMKYLKESWAALPRRVREAQVKAEWLRYKAEGRKGGIRKAREDWGGGGFSGGGTGGFGAPLFSGSDLGSNQGLDPNQFTEFTPWFSGPFYKNLPYAYFPGMASAREASTHNPIAKRIVQILPQYAFGRNFEITCSDKEINEKFKVFLRESKLKSKMRKYWGREYLTDGELTIDKARMISIDASTIMDVVCEGWDEFIDKPLYLQQMFETASQTYSGIDVPGVPKAKDSKPGKFIVRQIPADQVIRIKTNCTSQDKRGRPVLFDILGWLKRLKDTYSAQVLGEQFESSFVFDDTVDGSAAQVAAHAQKYTYIPVAPSIFVHNKAVERKAIQQTAKGGGSKSDISQEILAFLATSQGFPKDFFNVMASGSGSRATAIVGSEPFTKVIEDLQQDFEDLTDEIIEAWCDANGEVYNEEDWKVEFPPVSKDSNKDHIDNIGSAKELGAFNPRRASTMIATALGADDYDYDKEQAVGRADSTKYPPSDVMPGWTPPAGTLGTPPAPGAKPGDVPPPKVKPDVAPKKPNPIHGGAAAIKKQHKTL